MNTDNNVWAKLYEAIERANSAITGMDEYSDMSNANMRQFYGELLTLRAFIYFDLIKAFGDVPARFEPNTTETIDLPKTDRMVIMRRLLNDLLIAQDYVGWPNENSFTKSTERVSQTFTKGLRARIALFAAGYSQHPDGIRYNTEAAKAFIEWFFSDDENMKMMAEIDKNNTCLLVKPSLKGLELNFDKDQLMKEDLSLFGSKRTEILDKWSTLMGDKGEE